MPEVGAKPLDLEKMLQGEKRAYVWSWSKPGEFGGVAPNRKGCLALDLEQSKLGRNIAPILETKRKIDMEQ